MIVNTAVVVPVNVVPLIDDTDFKTPETGVVYNASGLALKWNFVTTAGVVTQTAVTPTDTGGDYDWTNKGGAMYAIEIPATGGASINNNAAGYGYFTGVATGVLPWRGPTIEFVPAHVANGLVDGTDNLQVDLVQWLGVAPLALSSQLVQVLDAAGITTLLNRLTSSRAGYLDNLSAGPVATSAEVTSIQNNTTTSLIAPANIVRPSSGTLTCYIRVYLTDEVGNMEAPDSAPTLDVRDAAGTDLTARLGSTTGTLEGVGRYRWVYTSTSTDEAEQILFEVTVVEGGLTRMKGVTSWVTDNASTDFTSTDRTKLEAVYNKLPANSIGDQTLLTASIAGVPDAVDAELSANHGNTAWGAATVIVTPFSATVSGGEVSDSGIITAYQFAAFGPITITITDDNDGPIDLRTLDLRFIGYRVKAASTAEKYFEIDGSEMSVGGAGHNVLTVDADDTATQTARVGLWVVRDVTNDRVLARGTLKIPAVSDAEAV